MKLPHLVCRPIPEVGDGADHSGVDVRLCCPRCGRRTVAYVECDRLTPKVLQVLRREWRRKTERPEPTGWIYRQ